MPRKATGKPLTLRPIRLDDDVWAECLRLGKLKGTINEGLRSLMLIDAELITPEIEQKIKANVTPRKPQDVSIETVVKKAEEIESRLARLAASIAPRQPKIRGPILRPKDKK